MFEPTRTAALAHLSEFVPKAGRYAAERNYDRPGHPGVSQLSPYIRHRLITEEEVLQATLGRFAPSTVDKFVQEVFWRTYWKGWLEMRPTVWRDYQGGVVAALNRVHTESGLRQRWEDACSGETGIEAFDHWANELTETGYLHNHARMWFASIWIFTLDLPWELGADFFLRHLLDGDPASNTLSWRWVAGLQTRGKTYLARPSNIAKYTDNRFRPSGLAPVAPPLPAGPIPDRRPIPESGRIEPGLRTGLLLHEDDLSPGFVLEHIQPVATASLTASVGRSPLAVSPAVHTFTRQSIEDATDRYKDRLGPVTEVIDTAGLKAWANENALDQVVCPYAPVGPVSDLLRDAGLPITSVIRPYDAAAWPHATAGFFKFKEKIAHLLERLGLAHAV